MLFPTQVSAVLSPTSLDIDKERHKEELSAFHAELLANKAKEKVERQLEATTSNINNEYRRRIKETREMIARLTKSAAELSTEYASLKEARDVLVEYLGKLQNPLKLNLQWVQLRKNHRRSSLTGQGASEAIDNNQRDLRGAVVKVTASINELETAIKRVDETIDAHHREIKDKNISVVLDSACLVPNLEVPVRDADSVKLHSSVMRKNNLTTENEWRNNIRQLLSQAPIIRQTARNVVQRAKSVVRWIVDNGFLDRPTHVIDVLKANVHDSEKQQKQLEYNARMVQGQMLALEKNRAQLLGTLEKVHQKVVETQRRLDMKLVRPMVEDSRHDIDEELERATTSLLQSELTIKNQLFDVETRRQRLILLYQDIQTELSSKQRAYAVDRACLDANVGKRGAGTADPAAFEKALSKFEKKEDRKMTSTARVRHSGDARGGGGVAGITIMPPQVNFALHGGKQQQQTFSLPTATTTSTSGNQHARVSGSTSTASLSSSQPPRYHQDSPRKQQQGQTKSVKFPELSGRQLTPRSKQF